MSIGYFNHYIQIQESAERFSESGDFSNDWHDIRRCWAHIDIIFNKRYLDTERSVDHIISTKNYYEITVRKFKHINNRMRILWGEKRLNILKHFVCDKNKRFAKIIVIEDI